MSEKKLTMDAELEALEIESFDYFRHETNLANGLVLDKTIDSKWPSSIAATGFALTAYPIGVERNLMNRDEAAQRTLTTLRFFWNSPQGLEPDATGYKGFYYHFLDMETGRRTWDSELSTIDSTLLIGGILTAGIYFDANTPVEKEIRNLSEALFNRVDWAWALNGGDTICQGWMPETGFLPYRWQGFDEALLLYILALGSKTHPIEPSSYAAWLKSYEWKKVYEIEYAYAGPLFTHHFSHIWVDFKDIQDEFMRGKNCDYFENTRRATYVHQAYAMENPLKYNGYNEMCWGITASDGPGEETIKIDGKDRQFYDYIARGAPFGPDDGTIAPWAAVASLPFAPEIVLPLIDHFIYELKLKVENPYGFKNSFNRTYQKKNHYCGWVSPWHYGINQGPMLLMVENFRTRFLWELMKNCPYIINGLKRAGFTGGYLA